MDRQLSLDEDGGRDWAWERHLWDQWPLGRAVRWSEGIQGHGGESEALWGLGRGKRKEEEAVWGMSRSLLEL